MRRAPAPPPRRYLPGVAAVLALLLDAAGAAAQVDQARAAAYFAEARSLCEREGGRTWGVSLCGPMVFADAASQTIATSQPAPDAPRPPFLGFANTAAEWGGTRWSTYVWAMVPADAQQRGRLLMHELFHRVQPQLGFVLRDGDNAHLDTLDGRYWIQLEWRALAAALAATGGARAAALADALAFRSARHAAFPGAAENERLMEVNEGFAQYTGTVAAAASREEAVADAIHQLGDVTRNATFVRTFPYPTGTAYGLLLDEWQPGWPRRATSTSDLAAMVAAAAGIRPSADAAAAAARYGGSDLRATEEVRDAEQQARVAALRRVFVDGPVLVLPGGGRNSFTTAGMTPIPGEGTVYPSLRSTAPWGQLTSERALVSHERGTIRVPAPPPEMTARAATEPPRRLDGEGWSLELAPGWTVRPGPRPGDYTVERSAP